MAPGCGHRTADRGTALRSRNTPCFARSKGYKRIKARLPQNNEPALSYLSSIGAMVPLFNPGTSFELPIYQGGEEEEGDS